MTLESTLLEVSNSTFLRARLEMEMNEIDPRLLSGGEEKAVMN